MFNINDNVTGHFRLQINVQVYLHAHVACMPHALSGLCKFSFVRRLTVSITVLVTSDGVEMCSDNKLPQSCEKKLFII